MPKTHEVFGISQKILPASYIDRGELDTQLRTLLDRDRKHVALRGASKCGKSWLRTKVIKDPLVVQCRLDKTVHDLYIDALSQLEIDLTLERTDKASIKGSVKATGSLGVKLLGAIGVSVGAEAGAGQDLKSSPVGRDINDLRFVVDIIKASGKRLVIEDFHYLSVPERTKVAFDLKALWEWNLNVVVVGIWSQDNMLLTLNPDLAMRIDELSVTWTDAELESILDKGGNALGVEFLPPLKGQLVSCSFGNAGLLQALALAILDAQGIHESVKDATVHLFSTELLQGAAMELAEQLSPLYQEFSRRVSDGIRTRQNATGIYAHAMAVVMDAGDAELIAGIDAAAIYAKANARQPRIQLGNLKAILSKLDALQVDKDGRGLVLTYNPATERVAIVDRQLLLYRQYSTLKWPWEDLIKEADAKTQDAYEGN